MCQTMIGLTTLCYPFYYYSIIKGNLTHTAVSFLGLISKQIPFLLAHTKTC
jgi:hypothetical protein